MDEDQDKEERSRSFNIALVIWAVFVSFICLGTVLLYFTGVLPPEHEEPGLLVFPSLEVEINANDDTLVFHVMSIGIDWSEFIVRVDNDHTLTTTFKGVSEPGDVVVFSCDGWDPVIGSKYEVKIADIDTNGVVLQKDVYARA